MKNIFFLCLLVISFCLSAQNDSTPSEELNGYQGPFNKNHDYNNYAIKLKVLPWVAIPSGQGLNYSAGFEYGFKKNHSIGIDLFYHQYSFSSGDYYDSTRQEHLGKPRMLQRDKAVFLNYRYYFNFNSFRGEPGIAHYLGSYVRYGRKKYKFEEDYEKYETKSGIVSEDHYSFGIMYGIIYPLTLLKNGKQVNVDCYASLYVKQKVQHIKYMNEQSDLIEDTDTPGIIGFRIGLTLSFIGKR